jgi:hypothetical protein
LANAWPFTHLIGGEIGARIFLPETEAMSAFNTCCIFVVAELSKYIFYSTVNSDKFKEKERI